MESKYLPNFKHKDGQIGTGTNLGVYHVIGKYIT